MSSYFKNNSFKLKKIKSSMINTSDCTYTAYSEERSDKNDTIIPELPLLWGKKSEEYIPIRNTLSADFLQSKEYVDAFVSDEEISRELFLSLVLNEAVRSKVSFYRKRHVIKHLFHDYKMSNREIVEQYLKPCGWGGKADLVDIIIQSYSFGPDINQLLERELIEPDTAKFLNTLNVSDFNNFKDLFEKFSFSKNRQRQIVALISDIAKARKISLAEIINSCQDIFSDNKRTETQQLELLFKKLKTMKFPVYFSAVEKFKKVTAKITQNSPLKIEPIENFEEKGFHIQAKVKSSSDLNNVIKSLEKITESDLPLLFDDNFLRN